MRILGWFIRVTSGPPKFGFNATRFEGYLIYWFDLFGTTIYWSKESSRDDR